MPSTRSWFEIGAKDAVKGATDVYLYDQIGAFGISAAMFVDALTQVKTPAIELYVNSPGGDAEDGTAIYNALERHPAAVHATVDGMAASAASYIVQAADRITMNAGSLMMIHDPYMLTIGDAAAMQKSIEYLDRRGDAIAEIYAARAGGEASEWRQKMRDETWYKADEAVAAKLADEVSPAKSAALLTAGRAFNLAAFPFKNVPEWAPKAEKLPDPAPKPHDADHGWAFLAHHDATGAVDYALLRVALARVRNLSIPVAEREKALRHLDGHAAIAGIAVLTAA